MKIVKIKMNCNIMGPLDRREDCSCVPHNYANGCARLLIKGYHYYAIDCDNYWLVQLGCDHPFNIVLQKTCTPSPTTNETATVVTE